MSEVSTDAPASIEDTAPVDEVSPTGEETEDQGEGAEEQLLDAAKKPAPKKEAPKSNKRKLKLKVDGRELEEEIDLDDEEGLARHLQMSKVAQKRMQEMSQLQKEVQSFISELKKNPRKILSDPRIGLDVKQLAAEIIEEEIQNSQKSPEQVEREKLEQRLRDMEDQRKQEQEEFRKKEFDRLQQQEFERYDVLMTNALEKTDLPKSPYIIKKMADYMLMGIKNGIDVSPEDVVPLVRDEMTNDLKEMFAAMPDEVIEALVGKDVIGRIRKKNIARVKAQPPQPLKTSVKETGVNKENKTKDSKPVSYKDFFNF